ncbi:MAG: hypothetical protein HN348_08830 [Proteobacteria bacterium]|nr:hypothetical protein [Pseudomonadota bacterium]
MATGDESVATWYALLTLPGLRLRAMLGVQGTARRGRWRTILARAGASRGTKHILRALADYQPDPEGYNPQSAQEATDSLAHSIGEFSSVLQPLVQSDTLGGFARKWADFLKRWWVQSQDRQLLINALESIRPAGPKIQATLARARIKQILDEIQMRSGTLSDQAIRVLNPMDLIGGSFEVVCCLGLTDGRFPRRASEDPLLSDQMVQELNSQTGAGLLTSSAQADMESRRFAAVVASCGDRLWLSCPAYQMIEGRPTLPSVFLLDVATVLLGHRARFADLETLSHRRGSRKRSFPVPVRAIHLAEHRASRVSQDPVSTLPHLATHPATRRLLCQGTFATEPGPNPYNGLVQQDRMPIAGCDGEGIPAYALALLLRSPERFFLSWMLNVYRPPRFPEPFDPCEMKHREKLLLRCIVEVVDRNSPLQTLDEAWKELAAKEERHSPLDDASRQAANELAGREIFKLRSWEGMVLEQLVLENERLAPDLPWHLSDHSSYFQPGLLQALTTFPPPSKKRFLVDGAAHIVQAIAAGMPDDTNLVVSRPVVQKSVTVRLGDVQEDFVNVVKFATEVVTSGWWPPVLPEVGS